MRPLYLLLPALWAGCSPTLFEPTPCASDLECGSVFGAGTTCGVDGYCTVGDASLVDGVSDRLVKAVGFTDLNGSQKDLGLGMRDGIQAAIQAHNRENPGARQFSHEMLDDSYNPDTTVALLRDVLAGDEGGAGRSHFAVVGSSGTPTTVAMLPLLNQHQVPLLGTYSGARELRATPPDRIVFNTRASYRLEGKAIAEYLLHRTPTDTQIAPENLFAFAQSPLDIGSNGLTDIGASADEDLDSYGASGFSGVREALREVGLDDADIALASYRATNTDTHIASDYFFRWLCGLERLKPAMPESGRLRVGVTVVSVASSGTSFIQQVIDGMDEIERGEAPPGLTAQQWAEVPTEVKSLLARSQVVIATLSPVGDQLPANLRNSNAERYCQGANGDQPIIVSQVVPFPTGGSSGAVQYREDLEAYDANLHPGFVSFEGWIVGRTWVEAVLATGGDLTEESLFETLEDPSFSVNVGEVISFAPDDHDGSSAVYGTVIDPTCAYAEYVKFNDLNPQ